MEATFWQYGHDLADLYRDRLTIRQLWVRVHAAMCDEDSPLVRAIQLAKAEAEEAEQSAAIDDALAMMKGG